MNDVTLLTTAAAAATRSEVEEEVM